ncbi:MAG TPA: hypothetical protein VJT09_09365 [Pyrinomonadaceae bacterium]|nr:hypothetical protein [Pyrinomonadaceae bacterium]
MAELFDNFEVNRTPRWKRLLRLSCASFVLHALFFVAILYVPILREMFHVADRFSNVEYVDEDYEKTVISDRAVMLEVSRGFRYPPGYFDDPRAATAEPKVVEQPTPKPTPKPTPTPTPTPTPGPSPQTAPGGTDADSTIADGEKPKTKEEAEKVLDDLAAKNGVVRPQEARINKKPLKDWLGNTNVKYKAGEINLNATIEVIIVARRDEKGKLHDPKVVSKTGDKVLAQVATDLVAAINDSNVLYFLEGSGGGQVRFVVRLDSAQVTATVESEVESEARATTMARTYGSMLFVGKVARSDKDEAIIYQNTRISARGKQVVVNFSMPRQAAGDMLKKQLPAG